MVVEEPQFLWGRGDYVVNSVWYTPISCYDVCVVVEDVCGGEEAEVGRELCGGK